MKDLMQSKLSIKIVALLIVFLLSGAITGASYLREFERSVDERIDKIEIVLGQQVIINQNIADTLKRLSEEE